jgi:hypothetical protein
MDVPTFAETRSLRTWGVKRGGKKRKGVVCLFMLTSYLVVALIIDLKLRRKPGRVLYLLYVERLAVRAHCLAHYQAEDCKKMPSRSSAG